jgi:very-short-patch-repair endonuclease
MKCKICGFEGKSLVSHITRKHGMTTIDYKRMYNVDKLHMITDNQKEILAKLRLERKDDPYWIERMNKNRKSVWKVDYWLSIGYSEEDAIKKVKEYQSNNAKKRDYEKSPSVLSKQYWFNLGHDDEFATNRIAEIQSKLSANSKKFYGKRHTEDAKKRISQTMKSHINSYGKTEWALHFGDFSNYRSDGEVEIFNFVNSISKDVCANEFLLDYNVDILVGNKIIEYFGDFWHGLPTLFLEDDIHPIIKTPISEIRKYDEIKIKTLQENGYEVLIVVESEFLADSDSTFNKIKRFLGNDTSQKN